MKAAESRLADAFIKVPSETVWMWSLLQGHPAAWPDQRSCTLWFSGWGEDPGEESWSLGFYLKHRGEHTQGRDTWQRHLSSQEALSVDPLEVLWGIKRKGGNIKGEVRHFYNIGRRGQAGQLIRHQCLYDIIQNTWVWPGSRTSHDCYTGADREKESFIAMLKYLDLISKKEGMSLDHILIGHKKNDFMIIQSNRSANAPDSFNLFKTPSATLTSPT